ncbi:MAG: 5'-nucleotidase C-terminal domain-containing protein, partial [Gammaproteobacteria bacterium]|nr:5'-nucleotidase C-terminal domain-containing protein [Gammaproteobacteria bacterium]
GRVTDYRFRLIPVFSDVITPDPGMQALVEEIRAPYRGKLDRVLGETQSLLYRRGNLNGTFDDLILAAIREARDAEIALSPGFRWGASLVPGQNITVDDVYNQTAITYPEVYRTTMTGARLKAVLEDVADNLFNPDPYYQQGGDMVRVAGLAYRLRVNAPAGRRIEQLSIMPGGEPIDASREYVVTGWASVNEDVEGPPVYDIVSGYIESLGKAVRIAPNDAVQIV